ncbi:yanA [Symbiodinium microadriaticum]|nr:yanA [Symbiodinium microadriaticum]CAE7939588.1 yanA [Symbiodinium sp. KB8]
MEIPLARWDVNAYCEYNDTVFVTHHGSFLAEIDLFDAAHFEMSLAEAAVIDPGQRLVLQCACEVLMPQAEAPNQSAGCAVVVAQFQNDWSLLMESCSGISPSSHASAAVCACIAANRVSFSFDLNGPSFAIDTACSSALVAEPHQHWLQQSTSCCTPQSFDTTAAQDCFRAVAAVAASMPVQMATAGRRPWELFISTQGDPSWKPQQSLALAAVRASQRPVVARSRSFCMKLWNKHVGCQMILSCWTVL